MRGESVMSLAPCEPTGSSCSTPGFTPGSLPILLPIPGLTPSPAVPVSPDRPCQAKPEPSAHAFQRVRRSPADGGSADPPRLPPANWLIS
jgi:hypothetical protein